MLKNVGTMDAYLRVTGGLMMVALGAAAAARRPGLGQMVMVALGAGKVAEGITRYDPMFHAMGWSTMEKTPAAEWQDKAAGVADQVSRSAERAADRSADTADRITRRAEEYLT